MSATAGWVSSISYVQGKSPQLESVSKVLLHLVDRQLCSGCVFACVVPGFSGMSDAAARKGSLDKGPTVCKPMAVLIQQCHPPAMSLLISCLHPCNGQPGVQAA